MGLDVGDGLDGLVVGGVGPTGRPMPDVPRAAAAHRARPRPDHRDVQPEGRRRQDDDHHQPGRGAGRVRPQGAAGRLRPAGRALGRPRASTRTSSTRPIYNLLMRAATSTSDDVIRPTGVARPGPAAGEHRPVRRRGAAGQRGGPRAGPGARAAPGARRVRRHADRLPALARPADGQRADRRARRRRSRWSASSSRCAAWRCSSRRSRRSATGSTPRWRSTASSRPCTTPHPAQPRGRGARRRGVRRQGLPHGDRPHR